MPSPPQASHGLCAIRGSAPPTKRGQHPEHEPQWAFFGSASWSRNWITRWLPWLRAADDRSSETTAHPAGESREGQHLIEAVMP